MEETDWDSYGRASGNPKCQDCMVHCGYEPAAVEETFGSMRGMMATAALMLFGARGPKSAAASDRKPAVPARPAPHGSPLLPILK
jgi:hypothetical protein